MTRSKRCAREARRASRMSYDEPPQPARPLGDDDVVDVRVVANDRFGGRLDEIGDARVGKAPPERRDGRRREDDVADQAQPDEQNLHPSTPLGMTLSMSRSGLDRRLVDQHDRDVVLDRIHAVALVALERRCRP